MHGRRAADGTGHLDKKLEEDILFKEIGGQLDAKNFDYSEWQRTAASKAPKLPPQSQMQVASSRAGGIASSPFERPSTGRPTAAAVLAWNFSN